MSGLKTRNNRRGRLKRNKNVQQNTLANRGNPEESSLNLPINKPLRIVRMKAPSCLSNMNQAISIERDEHNGNNSNNNNNNSTLLDSVYSSDNHANTVGFDLKRAFIFEPSDLSSEDSASPLSPPITKNDKFQGVDLARLPKVHYTTISLDNASDQENVHLQQQHEQEQRLLLHHNHSSETRNSQIYKRPENHYIHYIEPSDIELYDSVEYDMDEQDKFWLQIYNDEKRKDIGGDISPYLFECIMDKLEKEWFNLLKNAPKPEVEKESMFPEDSACAICDDTEVENSNAIVFCDGCNVAVHQDCYGIPYIPEGQWLCRKCMISPEFPVSCIFCPNEGGAFKQTNTNQWGHLLCAIWIPEVSVSNAIYMEPIDNIENVPKSRWKLTCSICRKKHGACIQCDYKHCFSSFHATCAKDAGLCMKMNSQTDGGVILKAYCEKHAPKEHTETSKQIHNRSRGRGRGRNRFINGSSHFDTADNKVARAHQHHYSTGVPLPPDTILEMVENSSCVRFSGIRKHRQLVMDISHYWSLKRESRRGAPLLKRLHLEPWTATASKGDKSDLLIQKSVIYQLRADLEKIRMLSEQVQKRERQKLERIKKQKSYLEMIFFPLEYVIQPILDKFMEIDRKKYFINHVTREEAPDYHSIVKNPMCFSEIQKKVQNHEYNSLEQFEFDITLIWQNSMDYNASDTSYYKVANKMKNAAEKLLSTARTKMSLFQLSQDGTWNQSVDDAIFSYNNSFDEHELIVHQSTIQEPHVETEHELNMRLEHEKLIEEKEKEHQRAVQARVEGKARARALRNEIKLRGEVQPSSSKEVRTLRPRYISPDIKTSTNETPTLIQQVQPIHIENQNNWLSKPNHSNRTSNRNEYYDDNLDKQVASLQVPQPEPFHSFALDYFNENLLLSTNNENELTINNFDQYFQHDDHSLLYDISVNTVLDQQPVLSEQISTQSSPIATRQSSPTIGRKRQRTSSSTASRRLTRSDGLQASIEELTKRHKISQEAQKLCASYNGVSHLDKPTKVFKEDKKIPAPIGWVYVNEGEEQQDEEVDHKPKFTRQSRNGIPIPNFQRGEIIWARVDRYPSHPAKFLNYSDEEAGPKLVANRRFAGDVLVEFLKVPEMHRYGWVGRRTIGEIGDPETDKIRLAEALQKRPRRNVFIQETKEGYRCAGSILGLDVEPLLQAVFDTSVAKKKK